MALDVLQTNTLFSPTSLKDQGSSSSLKWWDGTIAILITSCTRSPSIRLQCHTRFLDPIHCRCKFDFISTWCKMWPKKTYELKLPVVMFEWSFPIAHFTTNDISRCIKVQLCYLVWFSCSPTSTNWVCTTKLVLHLQIYDEASTTIKLKN